MISESVMATTSKGKEDKLGYFIPTKGEYCRDVSYYNCQRTVFVHPVTLHDLLNENLTYYLQQARSYVLRINTERKSCSQAGHVEIKFDTVQDAQECLLQLDGTLNDFRATRSLPGCIKWEKALNDGNPSDEIFSRTVALANLPESVTEEFLYEKFPDAVQIVLPRFASDHPNERMRDELTGFAFITLITPELAVGLQNTKIDVGDEKPHNVHALRDYPSQNSTIDEISVRYGELHPAELIYSCLAEQGLEYCPKAYFQDKWDLNTEKWVIDKRLKAPLEPYKRERLRILTGACGHYRRYKGVPENERKEFDEWAELMRQRLKEDQRRQREIETGVFFNREGECLPVDPNFLEQDEIPNRPGFGGAGAGPMGPSPFGSGRGSGGYWEEEYYPLGSGAPPQFRRGPGMRGPSEGPVYSTGNESKVASAEASVGEKLERIRGKVDAVDLLVGLTNLLSQEAGNADSSSGGLGQRQPVKRLLDIPVPAGGKRWQGDDYDQGYGRGGYGGGYGHGYRGGYGGRRGRGSYGYY